MTNQVRQNTDHQPASQALMAAFVFLVALNLRPAIVAAGPLLEQIGASMVWGETVLGLLGALPLLAFALVSPLVRFLTVRVHPDTIIFAALLVLAAGCIVRSTVGAPGVWLGTVAIGSAIAVGNVLVPVIVKRDYVEHVSVATGVYSACITTGSSIAGLTAAALSEAWGSWQGALAFWAIPPLVVALLWFIRLRLFAPTRKAPTQKAPAQNTLASGVISPGNSSSTTPADSALHEVLLWRRAFTWWVTLLMGLQSAAFYTMSNWLPSVAGAAGFSAADAGFHLFVFQATGILSGLLIPRLMYVRGNQTCAALVASFPMVVAGLGWLFAPQFSLVWSLIGGVAQGASLVVALTLISIRGRTQAETVALSGIAQSLGYLLSSIGPVAFGALAEASGDWAAPLVLFTTLAVLQCFVGFFAGRVPRAPR